MYILFCNIIWVALGSAIGGVCRYLLSKFFTDNVQSLFPWGTFAVNVAGCFIIGLIYGLLDKGLGMPPGMKLFLTVGFCGGFTTFSTFMNENFILFGGGNPLMFLLYASSSFAVGLLLLYGGYLLGGIAR